MKRSPDGECTFLDKVQNAQAAGAAAVVMYDYIDGEPLIRMGWTPEDERDTPVRIPSVFVSALSGAALSNLIEMEVSTAHDLDGVRVGVKVHLCVGGL